MRAAINLVSRTRCSVQRCCAEPGPTRMRIWAPDQQRTANALRCIRGTRASDLPDEANQFARIWLARPANTPQKPAKTSAPKNSFRLRVQIDPRRHPYRCKNFSLRKSEIMHLLLPSRLDRRGVRVVTDVAAGCGGRERVARRATRERTAKSRGPGTPTLVSSLRDDIHAGDGG